MEERGQKMEDLATREGETQRDEEAAEEDQHLGDECTRSRALGPAHTHDLDKAPQLTTLARGHVSRGEERRSGRSVEERHREDEAEQRDEHEEAESREGQGHHRRAEKRAERKVTGAPRGRSPREATRGIWTDSAPSLAALAPKRERPKKGRKRAPARARRRPKTPFGSRSGQGLDAPSPPLLEKKLRAEKN